MIILAVIVVIAIMGATCLICALVYTTIMDLLALMDAMAVIVIMVEQ